MKARYNIFIILLLVILVFPVGCSEFDTINKDPNTPVDVSASLLASQMIMDMTRKAGGNKNFTWDQMLAKYFSWTEGIEDMVFNKIETAEVDFEEIPAGIKMIEYASEVDKDAYRGLATLVKVYWAFRATMQLGDVPYSEAGKAEDGLIRPQYDTQKDVMIALLKDLDSAYDSFNKATSPFSGDPIYNGNIANWKKVVTAMQLKILINLSKKENDPDLKIKEKFAGVFTSKTLMESNADNLQLVYRDKGGIYYPYSKINSQQWKGPMLSTVLIDTLKRYEDYRLFYYAEPSVAKLEANIDESEWDAYVGVDPSALYTDQRDQDKVGLICGLNKRYIENNAGEPVMKLGYAEQQFILAEAALRKWINGDPAVYYKQGIEAAMKFVADNTPSNMGYEHKRKITNEYIQDYINSNKKIQLTGNFESDLCKIITQKYLSGFLQFQWDPYFDYRRTGYPVFPINPLSSMNNDGFKDKLPVRWRYSQDQYNTNRENLDIALKRQFPNGQDSNNELMWILKE